MESTQTFLCPSTDRQLERGMSAYAAGDEDGGGRRDRGVDHITESWTGRELVASQARSGEKSDNHNSRDKRDP